MSDIPDVIYEALRQHLLTQHRAQMARLLKCREDEVPQSVIDILVELGERHRDAAKAGRGHPDVSDLRNRFVLTVTPMMTDAGYSEEEIEAAIAMHDSQRATRH